MAGALALVVGVFASTWGVGTSGAQEHHGNHGHEPHDTTTTSSGPGTTTTTVQSQPGAQSREIRYGPFNIPAARGEGHEQAGMTGNQFRFFVEKPCTNCYITDMQADLVDASGRQVGMRDGYSLHHMVLANWTDRQDATCYFGFPFPLGLMFGQRFFASGDERTDIRMPAGYGYRVNSTDTWNLIYDLMNMNMTAASGIYIKMHYEYVPMSTPGMTNVEPIWMDLAQCGFSEISRPVGQSQASWSWTANRTGNIVTIGGHIHDGGTNIVIRNDTTGQVICDSRAGYGETPLYQSHHGTHISSMSKCTGSRGSPVARVTNGQRITETAYYNMHEAVTDQMGIVMAFIAQE